MFPQLRKIAVVVACVFAVPATFAAPVGNVANIAAQGQRFDIRTDRGALVVVDVLEDGLFRIQAGADGKLTGSGDKAAPIVIQTQFAAPQVLRSEQADYTLLKTKRFALRVYKKPLHFALYRADNAALLWQELQPLDLSAAQSFQTLSSTAGEHFYGGGQQNGQFDFKGKSMEISYSGGWEEGDRPSPAPFYMTSAGYGVLRNTWSNGSYDFRSNDFITTTHREARFDAYYFVGDGIHDVLAAYTQLTGGAALLPRWAYEFGDADCYNDGDNVKKPGTVPPGWSDGPTGKTPDVIASVAAKYREFDMPGGWILPNDGYGCGYTDLPGVVQGLKRYGFHTGLWTENGVDKIKWEVGTAGTRVQKLDVAWTGKGYQFALDANADAAAGILNSSDSRPFIWTVMGWAGMQRYAVTWTGDQSGSWDYIRWHIPTLIGSGLSGQTYATGDVDGIFGGSPETYTRDLQWKSFTPVLMGMSGWSKAERKHPWWFDEPYRSINRRYLKLKMRLMPYMYTTAWESERTAAPIVRGMMWDHPQDPSALGEAHKYQFFLGRDFLVAPVFRSQAASQGWRKDIYLPQGRWVDYWDGRVVEGPAKIDMQVTLDRLPVFVRGGAILPMYPEALYDGQVPKDVVTLDIYPQGRSSYTMYEDDGNTRQYKDGKYSTQRFDVDASEASVRVTIGAITGSYAGQEEQRVHVLQLHTRAKPTQVTLDNKPLAEAADRTAFDAAVSGWFFDASDKYGTVLAKTPRDSVRTAHVVALTLASAPAQTAGYPSAPDLGNAVPADSILVLNRPAEEPGQRLENAFDGKPDTWFRTIRDQSQKTGAHEFTLALGERRMVTGFEISPRNDKHWESGQVRDFEVYLGDRNGEWGKPVYTGRLKLAQGKQTVSFPPKPGSLFRFRVLSTQEQAQDDNAQDPMVTATSANGGGPRAYNAFVPPTVNPITISEFRVLEAPAPTAPQQQVALSDVTPFHTSGPSAKPRALRMNGLLFRKGLVGTNGSAVDYALTGNWSLFRADVGVDDSCGKNGVAQFQVFGDGRLLFDSGMLKPPAVVKPELDIRGLSTLRLQVIAPKAAPADCANWANATVIGYQGDKVGK